jgi:hypothetical protein
MKTLFKLIFGLLFLVFFIAVLAGGYFGIIPGVSKLFGSDKPRDFGIKATDADYASESAKGIKFVAMQQGSASTTPAETRQINGSKAVSASFTAQELTAAINKKPNWIYSPVSDVQFRFNPDGTGEVSGVLRVDHLRGFAEATGISQREVGKALDYLRLTNSNPAFYLKGYLSIADGKIDLDAQRVEIGRFPVPLSVIGDNKARIISSIENKIVVVFPGLSVKSLNIEKGQLQFEGTLPELIASVGD